MILTTPSKKRQRSFCANSLISIANKSANKSTERHALPSCTFLFCVGSSKSIAVPFWILKELAPYWFKLLEKCLFIIYIIRCIKKTLQNCMPSVLRHVWPKPCSRYFPLSCATERWHSGQGRREHFSKFQLLFLESDQSSLCLATLPNPPTS